MVVPLRDGDLGGMSPRGWNEHGIHERAMRARDVFILLSLGIHAQRMHALHALGLPRSPAALRYRRGYPFGYVPYGYSYLYLPLPEGHA